ncbi:MAG: hypothetical protein ACRCY4_07855 [Brevinema sp.]
MKYIVLFIIFMTGCSVLPDSSNGNPDLLNAETLSQRFPFWDVRLGAFTVLNDPLNPEIPSPTALQIDQHLRLSIADKRLMLRRMDLVRFVVNTPEFEQQVLRGTFVGTHNAQGPLGTMRLNERLDNARLLKIIKARRYPVEIRKAQIPLEAAAVGQVGSPLYVLADDDIRSTFSWWIALPNRDIWTEGRYRDDASIAGTIFHEMLHNTGFGHIDNVFQAPDPVYGVQLVLENLLRDTSFRLRYNSQITSILGLYESVYASQWLVADTVPVSSRQVQRSLSVGDGIVCVLGFDGSHKMVGESYPEE